MYEVVEQPSVQASSFVKMSDKITIDSYSNYRGFAFQKVKEREIEVPEKFLVF